ncbi:uncharacterized protein LOC108675223 isoform X3 [Hyalella azteca]|uniref:Uncharacterized protein LOC108675223 isoform X3 n=1 Tax=Hyalella azteca TaxID=294128 RepID=A0A8B7NY55_HYAAZ|nr:uncharacterized protein LOC108675223 isoform X3 [Hyalella azteca]
MYRQRLKGGHRVGISQQQNPSATQHHFGDGGAAAKTGTHKPPGPPQAGDAGWGFGDDWGWGESSNSSYNTQSQPYQAAEHQPLKPQQPIGFVQPHLHRNTDQYQPNNQHTNQPAVQQYHQPAVLQYQHQSAVQQYQHQPAAAQQYHQPGNNPIFLNTPENTATDFSNNNSNGTDIAWSDNWEADWSTVENQEQSQHEIKPIDNNSNSHYDYHTENQNQQPYNYQHQFLPDQQQTHQTWSHHDANLTQQLQTQEQHPPKTHQQLPTQEQQSHEIQQQLPTQEQQSHETQQQLPTQEQQSHETQQQLPMQEQQSHETQQQLPMQEQQSHEIQQQLQTNEQQLYETWQQTHEQQQSFETQQQLQTNEQQSHESQQQQQVYSTVQHEASNELQSNHALQHQANLILEQLPSNQEQGSLQQRHQPSAESEWSDWWEDMSQQDNQQKPADKLLHDNQMRHLIEQQHTQQTYGIQNEQDTQGNQTKQANEGLALQQETNDKSHQQENCFLDEQDRQFMKQPLQDHHEQANPYHQEQNYNRGREEIAGSQCEDQCYPYNHQQGQQTDANVVSDAASQFYGFSPEVTADTRVVDDDFSKPSNVKQVETTSGFGDEMPEDGGESEPVEGDWGDDWGDEMVEANPSLINPDGVGSELQHPEAESFGQIDEGSSDKLEVESSCTENYSTSSNALPECQVEGKLLDPYFEQNDSGETKANSMVGSQAEEVGFAAAIAPITHSGGAWHQPDVGAAVKAVTDVAAKGWGVMFSAAKGVASDVLEVATTNNPAWGVQNTQDITLSTNLHSSQVSAIPPTNDQSSQKIYGASVGEFNASASQDSTTARGARGFQGWSNDDGWCGDDAQVDSFDGLRISGTLSTGAAGQLPGGLNKQPIEQNEQGQQREQNEQLQHAFAQQNTDQNEQEQRPSLPPQERLRQDEQELEIHYQQEWQHQNLQMEQQEEQHRHPDYFPTKTPETSDNDGLQYMPSAPPVNSTTSSIFAAPVAPSSTSSLSTIPSVTCLTPSVAVLSSSSSSPVTTSVQSVPTPASTAPPPTAISVPGGSIKSLRARKGSPFQPPKNINLVAANSAIPNVPYLPDPGSNISSTSVTAKTSDNNPDSCDGKQTNVMTQSHNVGASQDDLCAGKPDERKRKTEKSCFEERQDNAKSQENIQKDGHEDGEDRNAGTYDDEEEEDDEAGVPRFSRMVPGCGSSAEPQVIQPPHTHSNPPPMPTDRVVTGIDNPIAPPPQPHSGTIGSLTSQPQRPPLHPPKRSATIGSEENGASVPLRPPSNGASSPSSKARQLPSSSRARQPSSSTSSVSPPPSPTFDASSYGRSGKRGAQSGRPRGDAQPSSRRVRDDQRPKASGRPRSAYREDVARHDGEGNNDYDDRSDSDTRNHSKYHRRQDQHREGEGEGSRSSSLEGREPSYPPRITGSGDDQVPSGDDRARRSRDPPHRSEDPHYHRGRDAQPKSYRRKDESYRRGDESYRRGDESCRKDDESYRRGDESYRRDHESYRRGDESYRRGDESYRKDDALHRQHNESYRKGRDELYHRGDDPYRRDRRRGDEKGSREWEADSDWDQTSSSRRWKYRDYHDRGYPGYDAYYKSSRRAAGSDHYDHQSLMSYYNYYAPYYEQHPKYRDYCHNYYKHYPQYAAAAAAAAPSAPHSLPDERGSVRSGRSSAAEEVKKATLNSSRVMGGSSSLYDPYGLYPRHPHDTSSGDMSGRVSAEPPRAPSQRFTPPRYSRRHVITRFTTTSQLLLVMPESSSLSVMNIRDVLAHDPDCRRQIRALEAFPGPLTVEDTHKEVVVRFCEAKHHHYRDLCSRTQHEQLRSQALLWRYLTLLVRQNGKLCSTDLAALLVESANDVSQEDLITAAVSRGLSNMNLDDGAGSRPNTTAGDDDQGERRDEGRRSMMRDEDSVGRLTASVSHTSLASSSSNINIGQPVGPNGPVDTLAPKVKADVTRWLPQLTKEQLERVDRQLEELVCLGRRRDAIELAIEQRLWGHAMAIGSRMEQAVVGRVYASFMQCLAPQHVLHTLVQHVNGKRPDVTKSYSRSRWGEWRRHLATLVANPSPAATKDLTAIVALGDALVTSDVAAGHVCYLMGGGVQLWGHKLHLLGLDPSLFRPFSEASLCALQCTEVLEYGLSLASAATDTSGAAPAPSTAVALSGFVKFKLRYAAVLAEYGFCEEAIRYCEVVSGTVTSGSSGVPLGEDLLLLVAELLELSTRLKYHDRHYLLGEGETHDMPDPQWLTVLANYKYHLQQQLVQTMDPPAPSADGSHHVKQENHLEDLEQTHHLEGLDQKHHLEEHHLHQEAPSEQTDGAMTSMSVGPPAANAVMSQDALQDGHSAPQHDLYADDVNPYGSTEPPPPPMMIPTLPVEDPSHLNSTAAQDVLQNFSFQPHLPSNHSAYDGQPGVGNGVDTSMGGYGEEASGQSSPHFTPTHVPNLPQLQQPMSYSPYEGDAYTSLPSDFPDEGDEGSPQDAWGYASLPYTGGGADTSGPPSPAHQAETLEPASTSSSNNNNEGNNKSKDDDNGNKATEGGDKKGFLARIFTWKNNQAKLPDDKNPSIVWDEERKRWVNTDGSDDNDAPPPPPPMASASSLPLTANRAGPRRSRYVNPLDEKDRIKPVSTMAPPLLPQQQQPVPQQQMTAPQMPQHLQQMMPPQQLQMMPQHPQQMMPQQQPQMMPQQQQMMPQQQPQLMPQQQPQMMPPEQQMMPAQQQQMMPPQQQQPLAAPHQVAANPPAGGRTRLDSSSIDLDDADDPAKEDESSTAGGAPMFFNPAQFQQLNTSRTAPTNPRRGRGGGPQRRAFPAGGAAPPPPRA